MTLHKCLVPLLFLFFSFSSSNEHYPPPLNGMADRKSLCISTTKGLAIVEPQELSRCPNAKFQPDLSIHPRKKLIQKVASSNDSWMEHCYPSLKDTSSCSQKIKMTPALLVPQDLRVPPGQWPPREHQSLATQEPPDLLAPPVRWVPQDKRVQRVPLGQLAQRVVLAMRVQQV